MHCINCDRAASYIFRTTGVDDQAYCERHLPRAYPRSSVSPVPVEVPIEEPIEEEPAVEEKPRRTRRRKVDEEE